MTHNNLNPSKDTKLFDGMVIFTQVVECGSFSGAAEATGHSNSYISKTLNKLEARVGVRLLNRTTRSISLTPEGQVYYEQCQQLVLDAHDAMSLLTQSHIEPKGVLKVSCPTSFAESHLQEVVSTFMRQYPEVSLVLDLNDRHVDLVQDGFDLVIRATEQLAESSLVCRKIYSCKGYTVASHDYLKRFGVPKTIEQLKSHQCICYSNLKQANKWSYTHINGTDSQVEVKAKLLCNSASMELSMVLADHGICRLPEFVMEKALKEQKLTILFSDYLMPTINVYAIYPSRKHLSPKVRCFIDLLVEKMPKNTD
ncbi:LysR family transcriptional regulator [Colwellia psychrerythraea]|uniref:Transcriptional regulator, LysR family n=1 Tax=Colwellia psychrerythraea TaxID=28229 RepID=A0A099KQC1_COLPS|nr:LysR family transcriptional regulator [Colwellia psychrerythraea]KGJ91868.1 transcriptional regulator, LysR family [Colwellia psychrerythraea]